MSKHVASELNRMLELQQTIDPSTDRYLVLMKSIEVLAQTADMYDDIDRYIEQYESSNIVKVEYRPPEHPVEDSPFPAVEEESPAKVVEFPAVKAEQDTAQATAPVEEPAHRSYELAEVRAALVEARKKGVNVTEILHEFGVDNFSAFPARRYWELMERLEG